MNKKCCLNLFNLCIAFWTFLWYNRSIIILTPMGWWCKRAFCQEVSESGEACLTLAEAVPPQIPRFCALWQVPRQGSHKSGWKLNQKLIETHGNARGKKSFVKSYEIGWKSLFLVDSTKDLWYNIITECKTVKKYEKAWNHAKLCETLWSFVKLCENSDTYCDFLLIFHLFSVNICLRNKNGCSLLLRSWKEYLFKNQIRFCFINSSPKGINRGRQASLIYGYAIPVDYIHF